MLCTSACGGCPVLGGAPAWQVALRCCCCFCRVCKVSVKSTLCRKHLLQWTMMGWRVRYRSGGAGPGWRLRVREWHGRCRCRCTCRDLSSACVGDCPGSLLVLQMHRRTPLGCGVMRPGGWGNHQRTDCPTPPAGTVVYQVLTLGRTLRAPNVAPRAWRLVHILENLRIPNHC